MIAAADAELRQQKADIERQRMEEELVRVAADDDDDDDQEGEGTEDDDRDELYKNGSYRKTDSQKEKRSSGSPILLRIVSENQFSGKTYFYTISSRARSRRRAATSRPSSHPRRYSEEQITLACTGPQEKFNPEKSCRMQDHVPLAKTCLENMPEVILTQ